MEGIPQALDISHGSVSTILHDRSGIRKLTTRWIPKSFSNDQIATRACSALLKRFRSKYDFLLRLVTVDETWIHYYEHFYELENKAQSVGRARWIPEAKEVQDTTICCLFLNLKKNTSGCHFRPDEQILTAVEEWVNGKDPFSVLGRWHLNTVGLSASH